MAQPYDYTQGFVNPAQGFLQGLQIGSVMREQQDRVRAAEEQTRRREAMSAALADWRSNRTPEKTADLLLQFPEMADAIKASQGVIDDATKQQNTAFAVDVFGLLKNGMTDRAIPLLEERVTALKNTKGKENEARSAEFLLEQVRKNPDIALDTASLYLATVAPDVYKTVAGGGISELDKGYALNVQLYGKEQADAWRAAEEAGKGVITATGPAGTSYVNALRINPPLAASAAAGSSSLPAPKTAADVAALPPGTRFIAPDGTVRVTPTRNTMSNTPAPDVNANGDPESMTRAQYNVIVAVKGKAATDAYIARNNIKVTP